MGHRYNQLDLKERCDIARLSASGCSIRQIASALDRSPSTVAREMKRNISQQSGYDPAYADKQCRSRRWTGSKLSRDKDLREIVLSRLKQGWSPEQVAGWLKLERGQRVISYETIYRFIYGELVRKKNYSWRHYLPRAKAKRGYRGRKGGSPASFIKHRRTLDERPEEVNDRQSVGHWEADLMLFQNRKQVILALHERYSRVNLAIRLDGKQAQPVADAMIKMLALLPPEWRQTVTFDNGTEFAQHHELHDYDIETFFCDTYSPWQKGGVENAIGRLRRNLPRKTDLASISEDRLTRIIQAYNNTPRKCLDFKTPAEVFWDKVLHFKCESIFLLSQERH